MNHERTSPQPARVSRWRRIFLAAMAASLMLPSTSYAQLGIPSVPGIPGVGGLGGAAAGLGGLGGGASAAPQTLWRFLGFKGGSRFKALRDALVNRRGNFPGLEKKPMIKSLTDPSNMQSDNPAIKKAAETKSQADAAPQKVKALKYLATVGCDKCNPGVKEALMAALDDCTEEVRFEGAKALRAVAGDKCNACRKTCCDKQLTDKLFDVAFGRDEACCYKETSARVRKMARQALCACATPGTGSTPPQPTEGPKGDPDEVKPEDATKGTVAQTSGVVDPVEVAAVHREQKTATSSKQMMSALFAAPGVSGSRDGREKIVPQQIRSISPRERSQAYRTPLPVTIQSSTQTSSGVERAVVQQQVVVREPVVSRVPPVAREAAGAASIHSPAAPSQTEPSVVPAAPPAVTHAHVVDAAPAVPGDAGTSHQVQQTAGPWSGRPGSGVDLTERAAAQRRFEAETARGVVPEQINPNDPNSVPGSPLQRITRPINNLIKQQQELPDEEYFLPGGRKFKPHEPARPAAPRMPNQPLPAETVRKGPRAKPAPTPAPVPSPAEAFPEQIQEPVLVRKVKPKAVEIDEEPEEEAPVPGEVSKWLAKKPSKADSQGAPGQLTGRLKLFSTGSVPAEETAPRNTPDLADVLPRSNTSPAAPEGPSLAPAPTIAKTPKPVIDDPSVEEAPMPNPVVRRVKPAAEPATPSPVSVDPEFVSAPATPSKSPAKAPAPKPTVVAAPASDDADLADAPLPSALPKVAATKKPGTIEPTIRAAEVATSPSGIPIEVTKEVPAPQVVAVPKAASEPKMPVLVPRRRPEALEAPLPSAIPVASTPKPEPKALPKHAASEVPAVKGPKSPSIVLKPFQPEDESEEMELPEPTARTASPAPARTPELADSDAEPAFPAAEPAVAEAEAPLPPNLSAAKLAGVVQRGPATVAPRNVARDTVAVPAPAAVAEAAPKAEIAPGPEEIVHTPITLPETPRVVARPKGPLVVLPGKSFRKEFEVDDSESKQPAKAATRQPSAPFQLPGADLVQEEPKTAPFQLPGAEPLEQVEAPIQLPSASENSQPAGAKKGPKLFPVVPSKGTPMRLPGADLPETAEPMPPAAAPMILPGAAPMRRELPTPDAPSPAPITLPGQSSNRKAKNRQAAADAKPIKLGGMTIFLRESPSEMPTDSSGDRNEELAIGAAPEILTMSATAETPVILQQSHMVTIKEPVDSRPTPDRGRVQSVRSAEGLVELSFAGVKPAKGTRLSLVRSYPTENVYLGDVEVVESGDRVLARPTHWLPVQRISSGDQVCGEGDPLLAPVESSVAPAVLESR